MSTVARVVADPSILVGQPCQIFSDGVHAWSAEAIQSGPSIVFRRSCPCGASLDSVPLAFASLQPSPVRAEAIASVQLAALQQPAIVAVQIGDGQADAEVLG